jgi:uncharacterized membrane protein YphA (DoxX/SURF4 family)
MSVAAWLVETCRLLTAWTLVISAISKLRIPGEFRQLIRDHFPLCAPAAGLIAGTVIFLEIAAASLILTGGSTSYAGQAIAVTLFLMFTGVIVRALASENPIACGCFGGRDKPVSMADLVRNLFLLTASVLPLIIPGSVRPLEHQETILLTGVSMIFLVILVRIEDIANELTAKSRP